MKIMQKARRTVGRPASLRGFLTFGLLFGCFLLAAPAAFAEIPETIGFQGRLNQPGGPPFSGTVSMTVRIYNVQSGGTPLFTETHPGVVVSNGKFSIDLGSVDPSGNPISVLTFREQYWIGLTVAGDLEMTPRLRFNTVAYAHRAAAADKSDKANQATLADGLTNQPALARVTQSSVPFQYDPSGFYHFSISCNSNETIIKAGISRIDAFPGFASFTVESPSPPPGGNQLPAGITNPWWMTATALPNVFSYGNAELWAVCLKVY